jgi:subtilisin-like proprotein convertase family protein
MPSVVESAEFFVVGGPVEPERACYVPRAADAALAAAIRQRGLCCVLGAAAIGKTSLLLRAAHASRATEARVVYVSLLACAGGAEAPAAPSVEQVASRIAAALGIDVDVGDWWRENEPPLGEPRLVSFFAEIVLPRLPQPLLVLIDEIEVLLDRPARAELVDGILACHARREHDRSFTRLGFVLAGRAAPRQLLQGAARDAAAAGIDVVEPADFTIDQAYRLTVAFGGEPAQAQALMDRIYAWTAGHPYLTQKLARGALRKGGRLEDVERVVRAEILAPEAAEADAALAPLRARLLAGTRRARRAAAIARRLRTARSVRVPGDADVGDELRLAGVTLLEDGGIVARNRLVKELLASGRLEAPRRYLLTAVVALLVVAVLAGAGYWYVWQLPEADIATLESPTAAPAIVEDAYRRLRALPGFAERADALWRDALLRQSRAASTLAEATAANARLRALPGQDEMADRLLGEFWARRARQARFAEQRDVALLLAQRAALASADSAGAAELAELVGEDYPLLERTLELPSPPPAWWRMVFADGSLVTLDTEQRVGRMRVLDDDQADSAAPTPLTALRYAALEREIEADDRGLAGDFELTVSVAHPATAELAITLTGPNGVGVTLTPPSVAGEAGETFVFQAVDGAPLAALQESARSGAWRLSVLDRSPGNAGTLLRWGITFSETGPRDSPPEPIAIPDPARTAEVTVAVEGLRAAVVAAAPGPLGSVAVWNLATGALEHDLPLQSAPRHAALNATGTRVLAATDRALVLFDAASGSQAARVTTQTEFVLPPVFSADGAYVGIAERVDGAPPLFSVLRADDGSFVSSFEGVPDVGRWELGPGARYVALLGPGHVVRVVSTRDGLEQRRLVHEADVEQLAHLADGLLVTVDAQARVIAWPILELGGPPRPLGRATAPSSVSIASAAERVAYTRDDGAVAVVEARTGVELVRLLEPRTDPPTVPQIAADGVAIVTQAGTRLRRWTLPLSVPQSAPVASGESTAVALDPAGRLIGLGLASGQAEFVAEAAPPASLAYFGHRGPVTAAAIVAERGLAATGGADGAIRIWDTATGAPTGVLVPGASDRIDHVALSADGRYVASAARRQVEVAGAADGVRIQQLEAPADVTALALGGDAVVVADRSGNVTVVPIGGEREPRSVQVGAAVPTIAFAPGAVSLAIGSDAGRVAVLGVADLAEVAAITLPAPVRWAGYSPDGGHLLVATDAWLHAFAVAAGYAPVASRLVRLPARHPNLAAAGGVSVHVAGLDGAGALARAELDLAAAPAVAFARELVERDWSAVLGLRLDDSGRPVASEP